MSENKVYNVFQDNLGEYSVLKGEERILICTEIEHKEIAELFCDELNDLEEENYELKKENEQLKQRIIELKKEVDDLSNGEADWLMEEDL